MKGKYHKNIRLEYLYVSLGSMNLTHGLWMIYLASRGFSLLELGFLEGIYHVASFLMEVPTGAVADLWGRKYSRVCGRIMTVCAFAMMFLGRSFLVQALAFTCTALGNNLESGAGDALVYDSLLLDGKEHRYMHVAGRRELVYQVTAIIGFALGGYLALRSYAAVFLLSMLFAGSAAVCATVFKEPRIRRIQGPKEFPILRKIGSSMRSQFIDSIVIMRKRRRISFFIMFSELLFCLITIQFFYLQNHWISRGWTELSIGLVFSANSLIAGLVALQSAAIEQAIGERGVLTYVPLLLLLCLWGVAVTSYAPLFFIIYGCVEGILITAVGTYINRLLPSAQRATILSFQSMAFSLFMMVLFPITGAIAEHWSLHVAFICMAVAFSVLFVIYMFVFKPHAVSE